VTIVSIQFFYTASGDFYLGQKVKGHNTGIR